ncbi:hypothetical protein CONCODRAFT_76734 [Conidiobolus coronatus NRRL 28638]|uniref:TPR-like protein n=1 Tax=Conidiobolus coronatus (strain ATCC 28846 / CBS 209.66 / NRRL 28638) TaxID=796925 RepID=A0A137PI38_CONC2|nr:hypothetical protein CONCODRAFT_76734 [Conidiobolus coronatus NRRL 28638]|eukprot:KXN74663.1 hypothetical protein CONCODRAFT_76734 [Conidiobolus coronatus NRRL 28638]
MSRRILQIGRLYQSNTNHLQNIYLPLKSIANASKINNLTNLTSNYKVNRHYTTDSSNGSTSFGKQLDNLANSKDNSLNLSVDNIWSDYVDVVQNGKLNDYDHSLLNQFLSFLIKKANTDNQAQYKIQRVLKDFELFQVKLELASLVDYINMLASKGLLSENLDLINAQLSLNNISWNLQLYKLTIVSLFEEGDKFSAEELIQDLSKSNITPDNELLSGILKYRVQYGDLEQASVLFEEIKTKKNITLDDSIYQPLIGAYLSKKQYDKASELWEELVESGISMQNSSFHLGLQLFCTVDKEPTRLWKLFQLMNQLQVDLDDKVYYYMIKGMAKSNRSEDAINFFQQYLERELDFNPELYRYCIRAYFQADQVDLAESLYKDAQELLASQTDSAIYKSQKQKLAEEMILGYIRTNSVDQTMNWVKQLDLLNGPVSYRLLPALIQFYTKNDLVDKSIELLSQLIAQPNPAIPSSVYTTLFVNLVNQSRQDEAMEIYYFLKTHRPIKNVKQYTKLIQPLVKGGHLTYAQKLFEDMIALEIRADALLYSLMIQGNAKANHIKGVMYYHRIINMDIYSDPDVSVYNSLMDAYNKLNRPLAALQLWDMLTFMNYPIDEITCCSILDTCGHHQQLGRLEYAWQHLKDIKFNITSNIFTSYIEALARLGQIDKALKLVQNQSEYKITDKTITTLIKFLKKYDKDEAHFDLVKMELIKQFPQLEPLILEIINNEEFEINEDEGYFNNEKPSL